MKRLIGCHALVLGVALCMGCAEEALDVPLAVPEESTVTGDFGQTGDVTATSEPAHLSTEEPSVPSEVPTEPPQPSAARSVWNALLRGTAEAMDESTPAQPAGGSESSDGN